ncbi:MAG: stress response translation initiation inhibitor YciH [Deltaproteobacteria bacterium]|nr:stress response translation initiation inhibitor YciH [Deltaproteobacteria bacterium]
MSDNSRLVYSTGSGRICPDCGKTAQKCSCKRKKAKLQRNIQFDGIIRIIRESKGRKGKTVTAISGFHEGTDDLKQIAKNLKSQCGTGGSIKGGIIIIQGDHRKTIQMDLQKQGFRVKLAGG